MAIAAQDRFVEGAHQHGLYTVEGDAPATNRAYKKIILALNELREMPDRGEGFLSNLLQNEDLSVVSWAASYLLGSRPEEAVQALERVARDALPLIAFGAEMTLKEWRAGRLKVE